MNKKIRKKELSTTQLIAVGFLVAILIGTVLLMLPFASAPGETTSFTEALFTATTSVCVTGLVVVDTYAHWSLFGQIVILFLIQCGGLGIVSFTTFLMLLIGRNVTLKNRLLLEDAFNLNTLKGLVKFLKRMLKGTLLVEAVGAVLYSFVFIPRFGPAKGIFVSIFNAVSAFCNAGMDIIGNQSLAEYVGNPLVNFVTMALIMLGGIGFVVWWDVLRVIKLIRTGEIKPKLFFRKLSLHSKIVFAATFGLILLGTTAVFVLEYSNPETLGNLPFGTKIMAALFQSVTTRTAGFLTVSQKGLRDSTSLICMILMFIGGSPVGTAGGIKTSTAALLLFATWSMVRGNQEVTVFKRTIPLANVRKALAVVIISFMTMILATVVLLTFEEGAFMDIMYETVSAIGTVGLSRNYTGSLNEIGRYIIVLLMYLGRIGPISLAIAFSARQGQGNLISYPKEEVTIG